MCWGKNWAEILMGHRDRKMNGNNLNSGGKNYFISNNYLMCTLSRLFLQYAVVCLLLMTPVLIVIHPAHGYSKLDLCL